MKHFNKSRVGNHIVYTPDEGYVLTEYKEGDSSLKYVQQYTAEKPNPNLYAMPKDQAKLIRKSLALHLDAIPTSEEEFRELKIQADLAKTQDDFLKEVENYLIEQGNEVALKRQAIRAQFDKIGKIVQTLEGDGTAFNPYKNWEVGMTVEEGCWYSTTDGYLWEAIKSGTPTSTTDSEYFDVVGLD